MTCFGIISLAGIVKSSNPILNLNALRCYCTVIQFFYYLYKNGVTANNGISNNNFTCCLTSLSQPFISM